jgi:hypothetical protein
MFSTLLTCVISWAVIEAVGGSHMNAMERKLEEVAGRKK